MLLQPPYAGPRPDLLHQAVDDLDAGEIALMHRAIEEAADLVLELADALDGRGDEGPGELLVRQPLAALDRVHEMALDRIAGIEGDVVATLDHARAAAFSKETLGRDGEVERRIRPMGMEGGEKARATRAEDEDIGPPPLDRYARDGHGPALNSASARKAKATTHEIAAASSASRFWPSRQAKFSMSSRRSPPSRWTASRKTRTLSASSTTGRSVQRRKPSSRASPSIASPRARKWNGRNNASAMPESRCTSAASHKASPR